MGAVHGSLAPRRWSICWRGVLFLGKTMSKELSGAILSILLVTGVASAQDFEPELIMRINRFSDEITLNSFYALGDQNDDGFDDFIIDYAYHPGGRGWGAELYSGGSPIDTIPSVTFLYPNINFRINEVLGDINGDEYNDFIATIQYFDNNYYEFDHYKVFLGGDLDTAADIRIPGDFLIDNSYTKFKGIGDMNNDGYDDFAAQNCRRIFLFLGGENPDFEPEVELSGDYENNVLGAIASGKDINNDGFDDFIMTAGGRFDMDSVYVFFGGEELPEEPAIRLINWMRYDIKLSDDLNGDGYVDIIGRVDHYNWTVTFGGEDIQPEVDLVLESGVLAGKSITSPGDLNGDGFADVLAGNHGDATYEILIYFGGRRMDGEVDFYLNGWFQREFETAGKEVYRCGDLTGDGINDFAFYGYHITFNPFGSIWIMSADENYGSVDWEHHNIVRGFEVLPAFPNPFNSSTLINVELPALGLLEIKVYDIRGRVVYENLEYQPCAGHYISALDLSRCGSGIYFLSIYYRQAVLNRKLVLIK